MTFRRSGSKADPSDVRAANRLLMFDLLFPNRTMSRVELGRQTGLSRVAASEAVGDMLDKYILREIGVDERSGRGKRAVMLAINPDVWRIVSVDLSQPYVLRGALVNLCGSIMQRMEVPLEDENRVELDDVFDIIRRLLAQAGDHVLGIGVAVPGVVTKEGRVVQSTNLGWFDLELRDMIEGEFVLHTTVCNEVSVALLAERFLGNGSSDCLFVRLSRGIGAAVLVNDQLVYGTSYAAGEIGHAVVNPQGPQCACGKRGCLETMISALKLHKSLEREPERRREILEEAGATLGDALAIPTCLLDVGDIAVFGPADVVGDTFLDAATQRLAALTDSHFHHAPKVRRCELGDDIVLCGQGVAVIQSRVARL